MIDRIDDALNGPTDIPLAKISVFGNPHHGIIQAGSLIASQATKDAATGAGPTEWPHQNKATPSTPQGGGTWIFANNPGFSRAPEDLAADALIGHRWDNYELLGGRTRLIHGGPESCGENRWVWADASGETWVASLHLSNLTTTGIELSVVLTRLGLLGATDTQYTRGPAAITWAENLSTARQLNLVFQDATRTGNKAAFMVTGRDDGSFQGELPCTVFVVELSGVAETATVQATEYLSRGRHRNSLDSGDPHVEVEAVPNHQNASYTSNGFCSWNVVINDTGAPAAATDNYTGLDYTLYVYYDEAGTLHRVHVAAEDYYGMQSSAQIAAASWTLHDLEPCGSSNACDPTDDSRHAFLQVSWTAHYHVLSYSRLAIKLDGVDTDCVLHSQSSLIHSAPGSHDAWQEALAAGCSVPDNCAMCTIYALEYGNSLYSPPHIAINPGGETESNTGDLGGLFSDLPGLTAAGWNVAAIDKYFNPTGTPDPGWIKVGATDEVCRIECLDHHIWAFARSHEYTGHANQASTETHTMIHTPATPNGEALALTAVRMAYGIHRFDAAPYVSYDRMTGAVTTHATQRVCYL